MILFWQSFFIEMVNRKIAGLTYVSGSLGFNVDSGSVTQIAITIFFQLD
jgi:hypothetical protein